VEHQRKAVHAVAQAGRLRSVVENVTEMAAAAAAMNFGPQHPQGPVFGLADRVLERLIKTRPAGAALEFRLRSEQRQVAAGAGEDALAMLPEQRARSRTLGALLAQDVLLLRRQLRAPFRIGLFDLELLRGVRGRGSQPAEGRKAKQTGDRREQDTAVDHDGLRSKRNWHGSLLNTGLDRRSYTDCTGIFSLSCEYPHPNPPHKRERLSGQIDLPALAFVRICLRTRPGTLGTRAAWRWLAPWRPGSGLTIGLEQPRLANAFAQPCPFPITSQRAGGGGASPPPHPDEMSGHPAGHAARPNQFERRKQPPALVAPQNAARNQLPGHCRGVQTLTAEAAGDPQAAAQLADLRHAMDGLSDSAAPNLGNRGASELGKDGADPP